MVSSYELFCSLLYIGIVLTVTVMIIGNEIDNSILKPG